MTYITAPEREAHPCEGCIFNEYEPVTIDDFAIIEQRKKDCKEVPGCFDKKFIVIGIKK